MDRFKQFVKALSDKQKIRRSFTNAALSYANHAHLQQQIAQDLIQTLDFNFKAETVVDVGCGTGFLTQQLLSFDYQKIIALDLAETMLISAQQHLRNAKNIAYVCADAEKLPFQKQTLDGIVSNLALQWCHDLNSTLQQFQPLLKSDGQLRLAIFTTETLQELKNAWATVDNQTHVNHFYHSTEIVSFLEQAGFQNIQFHKKIYLNQYASVMNLMRELKAIGANTVLTKNSSLMTKNKMQQMIKAYEMLRVNQHIPATFAVLMVQARV